MEKFKLSRRDFLKFGGLALVGATSIGALIANSSSVEARAQNDVIKGMDNRPRAKKVVDIDEEVVVEKDEVVKTEPEVNSFDENKSEYFHLEDARKFLENETGSKWLLGDYAKEVNQFPWISENVWTMFSDLKTIGTQQHYVLMMPHSNGQEYSIVGVENVNGKMVIDYIDNEGVPQMIQVEKPFGMKELVGKEHYEDVVLNSCIVWPDIPSNVGDSTTRFFSKTNGVTTDGWVESSNGTRYHAFSSQNPVPDSFR